MRSLSLLALAAPLVSAVNLTSIALNQTVTKGQTLTVKWDSVSTDMPNLSLYLFNFVTWPPFYMPLEFDVHFFPGDSGSANVYIPCKDVASSHGFQIKAINGTNTYIILSETPRFSIIGDDCVDPATFHEPGCSSVSPPPRVRQRAIESNIVPRSGKVPDVIGWGPTGYNDPKFP